MIGLNYNQYKQLNEKEKHRYLYLKDSFNYCFIASIAYIMLSLVVYGFSIIAGYEQMFLIQLGVFIISMFAVYHFIYLIKAIRLIEKLKWKSLKR